MRRTPVLRTIAVALAIAVVLAGPGSAATKKKKKGTPTPVPTPAPTVVPTSTPTPAPELHKAAGSCLRYEPGAYIMLSEVGQPGRAFKIDSGTDITARPRRGARLRILYVDSPEGPIARKIMPGPADETKP
ncbi:MAG: hypothetical protein ABI768_11905 [Acidobacteriota bacterium]